MSLSYIEAGGAGGEGTRMGVPQAAAALRRDERAYPRQTPDVPSRQRAQAILVPARAPTRWPLAAACAACGVRNALSYNSRGTAERARRVKPLRRCAPPSAPDETRGSERSVLLVVLLRLVAVGRRLECRRHVIGKLYAFHRL